jgi:hypothetical protein
VRRAREYGNRGVKEWGFSINLNKSLLQNKECLIKRGIPEKEDITNMKLIR